LSREIFFCSLCPVLSFSSLSPHVPLFDGCRSLSIRILSSFTNSSCPADRLSLPLAVLFTFHRSPLRPSPLSSFRHSVFFFFSLFFYTMLTRALPEFIGVFPHFAPLEVLTLDGTPHLRHGYFLSQSVPHVLYERIISGFLFTLPPLQFYVCERCHRHAEACTLFLVHGNLAPFCVWINTPLPITAFLVFRLGDARPPQVFSRLTL